LDCSYFLQSTSANIILISISPALNPVIYTFAAKNFFSLVQKWFKRFKRFRCECTRCTGHIDSPFEPIVGIRHCSWFPCCTCITRFEDFETISWSSEESKLWSSAVNE
jgi:hypothetical protein